MKTRTCLLRIMILCLGFCALSFFPSNAVGVDLVMHKEFVDDPVFDGTRYVDVQPQPPEMAEWTIAAKVRPAVVNIAEIYVKGEVQGENGMISLRSVTSIDFCNGKEIITSLDTSTFVYRNIGDSMWKESPIEVFQPHSITWSDQLGRYFVADTDNHRIISFAHLDKPLCDNPNDLNCCDSVGPNCQPYRQSYYMNPDTEEGYMCRPHDLEYNPVDGYFYGVTAPWGADCGEIAPNCECNNQIPYEHTYLFRFTDITEHGDVVDGAFIDLKDLGMQEGRYTRAVTIAKNVPEVPDGRVYVVDSSRHEEGVYEIVNFSPEDSEDPDNFPTNGTDYDYYKYCSPTPSSGDYCPSSFGRLNDVEYFNGRWYGTLQSSSYGTLIRWETWNDFEAQNWEKLEPSGLGSTGYFLTKWDNRLFMACIKGIYHYPVAGVQNTGIILTNDQSGRHNDVLFGINPDPAILGLAQKWTVVHHPAPSGPRIWAFADETIIPEQLVSCERQFRWRIFKAVCGWGIGG